MGVPLAAEGCSPQVTSYLAVNIPNVPPKNLVQIGIGGWQAPRLGVKMVRERETTTMTVTDCVEMGIESAANRALDVAWDGADAVWPSVRLFGRSHRAGDWLARSGRISHPRSSQVYPSDL